MPDLLAEILSHKRREVERARRARPLPPPALPGPPPVPGPPAGPWPPRDFYAAVATPRGRRPNLIAEIKRASPSAGLIRAAFEPVTLARHYAAAGACALSVLTDEKYFGGRLEFIAAVKRAVSLPVLRKDFLIDPYQVYESRAYGADAVLLIGEILPVGRLVRLVELARTLGLAVLLEVHRPRTLLRVRAALGATRPPGLLLGINNRDLRTQMVDLTTTERLAPLAPPGLPLVAESGVRTPADVARLHAAGARALLVGETLLRSDNPRLSIRRLLGHCPRPSAGRGARRERSGARSA